jgi:RecB family endonuclease NucS
VTDLVEKHLEDIIVGNPELIAKSLKLEKRQQVTDDGRIDLLFIDTKGNKIVVEMKLHKIGRRAV